MLPAFTVLAVPKFARDFARFGPQEPLLAGRSRPRRIAALDRGDHAPRRCAGRAWVTGERSGGEPRWCPRRVPEGGRAQRDPADRSGAVRREGPPRPLEGALARASVCARERSGQWSCSRSVHVAIQAIRITLRGELVYGAEVDGGERDPAGAGDPLRLGERGDAPDRSRPHARHGRPGRRRVCCPAAQSTSRSRRARLRAPHDRLRSTVRGCGQSLLHSAAGAVRRRREPLARSSTRSHRRCWRPRRVFFAFMPPTETRAQVRQWTDEEQGKCEIVRLVAELERSGCVVAADGLDVETSLALPQLTSLARAVPERGVRGGGVPRATAVRGRGTRAVEDMSARRSRAGARRAPPRRICLHARGRGRGGRARGSPLSVEHGRVVARRVVGGRVVAVDRLGDEVERAILDLVEDPPHVLPDDPEAQ